MLALGRIPEEQNRTCHLNCSLTDYGFLLSCVTHYFLVNFNYVDSCSAPNSTFTKSPFGDLKLYTGRQNEILHDGSEIF